MRMTSSTIAALCLLTLASGCLYEIRDEVLECDVNLRNHRRAYASWAASYPVYKSVDNFHDFKHGFITGYKAMAAGGNGCPPALPPPCYWKGSHQNEWGKRKANAWFDGYSHGVLAAQCDGVVEMNRIVTRMPRPNAGTEAFLPMDHDEAPAKTPPVDVFEELNRPPLAIPPSPMPSYDDDGPGRSPESNGARGLDPASPVEQGPRLE
jgi:hypothetical protein